ncbi:MAG: glycosyltransferase family 4 protein [Deltaproteobacteria bacterium]|nr:glycosyltransferase family 4 protein [Deltaproteobacteria bacterium]
MLTSSFPRFEGDPAGIFVYQLSSSLSRKGVHIEVVCPHHYGSKFFETWDNIAIHRFPYFFPTRNQVLCYGAGILKNIKRRRLAPFQLPPFLIVEALYSFYIVRNTKADIIHAHWSLPQGLIGLACKRLLGVPCLTTIHGSDVYGLKNSLFMALNAMVIRQSDVCTVNSTATARRTCEISRRKDIEIIPMGFDPKIFKRGHSEDSYGDRHEKTLLYVGRLIDWKGVDYLIKAIPLVLKRFPEVNLVVVGDGPQKADLVRLSHDLGIGDKVVFAGKIPQEILSAYYSRAEAFVLPSIVSKRGETEGLGLVLLEAMACGTPVIGSDVGGIPDIIKDGETGLLARPADHIDLADKIITLLSDGNLGKRISSKALHYVRDNFSWDKIADRFIGIYKKIIQENRES